MKFQRARTELQIADRQKEIINACDTLYGNGDYENINLKAISEMTSIARSSIYNYYKTKEEILLDLLKIEYLEWCDSLKSYFTTTYTITKEEYSYFLADSLAKREKMMRLLSIHFTTIEKNCHLEKLVEFKKEILPVFETFKVGVDKLFPNASEEKKTDFIFLFFSSINGIYPMTYPTVNQVEAMKSVSPDYTVPSFKDMCYKVILLLISDL
ncbi:TetR/AcrR family transcriptional regulator [Clostridium estertheticum]|nr:hypothetical protein [Clostridium estertheticum]WAG66612.1 TetR/AcrR family transcriptional regulator [Clostridium estertheticum]